ncbi:hypothetical protein Rs2_00731 [Raphanus sativus]|nr:hypothetical protein Rs2_00731 [Raphanus sativus]
MLSSRNGSLLSLSNSPKFQATSSPGPREKEIVELFRKVQAQLRARAAAKREDQKVEEEEASKGQGKESETVDSLLKLLRKHSGEQSKKLTILTAMETIRYKPASSFRRKSPVPRFESPPAYSNEATFDEASSYSVTWTHKKDTAESHDEPQAEIEPEYDEHAPEYELDPEPWRDDNVTLDALSDADDEESLDDADDEEVDEAEEEPVKDLSTLKLMELRGIAKSRGLKGFQR